MLAVALFAICLRNDFVYDDVLLLQMDDRISPPENWIRYLTESYNGGVDNLYRPLVSLSYAVQKHLHPSSIWPFFAVNILLHAGCAAAVAELTRRIMKFATPPGLRRRDLSQKPDLTPEGPFLLPAARTRHAAVAMLAGCLFAVHPVHAEAVASVVGRAETLCALAMVTAMILFLRPMTGTRVMAIWACAVIAILSKEQGILLPLILLIQHRLLRITPGHRRSGMVLLVLMLTWTWAGYILFREATLKFWWDRSLLDWTQQPIILATGIDRWLAPVAILGRYAQLMLFPSQLSLDYGYAFTTPNVAATDRYLWLGIATAVVWCACALAAWLKRDRVIGFVLLAMAITYCVISNAPTLIGTIMGERLLYLPSTFVIIVAAMGLGSIGRTGVVIGTVLVMACSVWTLSYIRQFDDRLTLYQYSVDARPSSGKLRLLLVSELVNQNQLREAAAQADETIARLPEMPEAWYQAGFVALTRREYDAAERYLEEAMRLYRNPSKAAALMQRVYDQRTAEPATQSVAPR